MTVPFDLHEVLEAITVVVLAVDTDACIRSCGPARGVGRYNGTLRRWELVMALADAPAGLEVRCAVCTVSQ